MPPTIVTEAQSSGFAAFTHHRNHSIESRTVLPTTALPLGASSHGLAIMADPRETPIDLPTTLSTAYRWSGQQSHGPVGISIHNRNTSTTTHSTTSHLHLEVPYKTGLHIPSPAVERRREQDFTDLTITPPSFIITASHSPVSRVVTTGVDARVSSSSSSSSARSTGKSSSISLHDRDGQFTPITSEHSTPSTVTATASASTTTKRRVCSPLRPWEGHGTDKTDCEWGIITPRDNSHVDSNGKPNTEANTHLYGNPAAKSNIVRPNAPKIIDEQPTRREEMTPDPIKARGFKPGPTDSIGKSWVLWNDTHKQGNSWCAPHGEHDHPE